VKHSEAETNPSLAQGNAGSAHGIPHTELAVAFLATFSPTAAEVRQMLAEMRKGTSWDFLSALLSVPKANLRKWQQGSRKPSHAARRYIAIAYLALDGVSKFQLARWVCAESGEIVEDRSRPFSDRIDASLQVARATRLCGALSAKVLRTGTD